MFLKRTQVFAWVAAIMAVALVVSEAQASVLGSVGVNFGSNRSGASLGAGASAGVVAQTNWNNAPNASGSILNAVDDSSAATGMGVNWSTQESWSLGGSPPTGDGVLMKGWVAAQNNSGNNTVTLSNIPYAWYDLYLYVSHDRNNDDTRFTETGGALTDFVTREDVTGTTILANPFVFNEITASGGLGNYTKFSGLTQDSLSLQMFAHNASNTRGPLSGIQIVEIVPEPCTLVIWALGLLGLAAYARRRK